MSAQLVTTLYARLASAAAVVFVSVNDYLISEALLQFASIIKY